MANNMAPKKNSVKRLDQAKPTLSSAVKALRIRLGDTQQQFATRLNFAISTAIRYETTRRPRGKALSQLYQLAVNSKFDDVTGMFRQALIAELGESSDDMYLALIAGKLQQLEQSLDRMRPKEETDSALDAIEQVRSYLAKLSSTAALESLNAGHPKRAEKHRKETK